MTTLPAMFRAAAARDPGRPFLTFYDDATGERIELSWATTANWVAKTANLIVEDLDAAPGDHLALWLPTHWQSVVWYLAAWEAGLVVAPLGDPARCAHVVGDPGAVSELAPGPGNRVLVALNPLGTAAPTPPAGWLDHARAVPGQPDRFVPFDAPTPEAPALLRDGVEHSGAELTAAATAAAGQWGLDRASRVLLTGGLSDGPGLTAGLLAPLAAAASVVLCRNAIPAAVARRVETERVTHRLPAAATD